MKGGKREGAGRPKIEDKRIHRYSLCVTNEEAVTLRRYREQTGVLPSEVIRTLFENWLQGVGTLVRK